MERTIVDMFAINRFSSGRRVSVYNQIEERATALGISGLLPYLSRARAHDQETRSLDDRWQATGGRTLYSPEVRYIDQQVDPILSQVARISRSQIADLPEDDELHERVSLMVDDLFPAGVAAITSLPYVDQVAAVENIVVALHSKYVSLIRELGLERKVARLGELSQAYREAVDRVDGPVDFVTVRAARERGHAYLLEIVAMIIAAFHDSDDPDHVTARSSLLAPVLSNNDTVRALRRARRSRSGESQDGLDEGDPQIADDVDDSTDNAR